jgi:hypothetical protein
LSGLKKQYNYTLPITKLYQYPTVNGIAAYLEGNKSIAKIAAGRPKKIKPITI